MLWGGRWEGGSCLGTHVRIKDFKIKKKNKKLKKMSLLLWKSRDKFINWKMSTMKNCWYEYWENRNVKIIFQKSRVGNESHNTNMEAEC